MMMDQDQPITILLVDDDPDCRMILRDAINELKIHNHVLEAANGREAMEILQQHGPWSDVARPGLIYLDIEMPEMNGQQTLRAIRSDPDLQDIPVVMMTGVVDEGQMQMARANGANSYTVKPSNAEQMLRTVLTSTNYWLTIHQYPSHHLPSHSARR